jgi:ribose-phosphate pyrophosphokinase
MSSMARFLWIFLWCAFSSFVFSVEGGSGAFPTISAENVVLVSGNANSALAKEVASCLGISLGETEIKRFNDGEIQINIGESVRNKDVFIIQPTCPSLKASINDNLMELYLLIRTMKRASAASITAIVPYYGYARQDRKTKPRDSISASDVALLLEQAGVTRVVTVDLHCGQIQGFFHNVPVDSLVASTVFVPYFVEKDLQNVVVVSPDAGGVDRANKFIAALAAEGVNARLAILSKKRASAGVVDTMIVLGDVSNSDVIIVDDMCDTGGTLCKAAELLKDHGALRVFAAVTHPVFSGTALEKLGNSVIEEMIVSDTIPLKENAPSKIHCISVAPLLSQVIAAYATKNQVGLEF